MHLRELFLKEDDRSTAVFAFGRFNPPTIGHQKLIEKVQSMASQVNGKGFIFLTHTQNNKRVPYKFDDVQVVSAGQRDPDAEDVTGASASKAREWALKGQEHEFSKIVMGGVNGKVLYDKIQDALGVQVAENNKKLYNEAMGDSKPIVYIDMDGVIADFFGGVEKLYGVGHWKELNADNKLDLKQEVINRISGTDFFATLPKFESSGELISMVKEFTGGNFSINTSPLRGDNENSAKYKKLWIQNNIEQPDEIVVTGRKESYAKDKASGTPNILIDDRPVNIQRWQGAGGYGILYQANRDSLTKVKQALDQYGKTDQS